MIDGRGLDYVLCKFHDISAPIEFSPANRSLFYKKNGLLGGEVISD
jgi:hypothetical protein